MRRGQKNGGEDEEEYDRRDAIRIVVVVEHRESVRALRTERGGKAGSAGRTSAKAHRGRR